MRPHPSVPCSFRRRAALVSTAATAALLAAPLPALAQAWPNKPIKLIVPFPPGGGTDTFARPLAQKLAAQLGQSVVIDNRGGTGGNIGATAAAKSAPDTTRSCWAPCITRSR